MLKYSVKCGLSEPDLTLVTHAEVFSEVWFITTDSTLVRTC